jgi:FMN phosphatase YigB (HAD superfamily)
MIRAVLFDLDDTLVHIPNRQGWEAVTRAQVKLLREIIGTDVEPHHDLRGFLDAFWSEFSSRHPEPDPLAPPFDERQWLLGERFLGQMMRSHLGFDSDRLASDCWRALFLVPPAAFGRVCFADSINTLTTLRDRGLSLCVVTNRISPSDLVRTELESLGLGEMFAAVISAGEVGFRKPHPTIFERALDALGVEADEAVMIGDNRHPDIEPAVRMGMLGVLKRNGYPRLAEIDRRIVQIDTLDEALHLTADWV